MKKMRTCRWLLKICLYYTITRGVQNIIIIINEFMNIIIMTCRRTQLREKIFDLINSISWLSEMATCGISVLTILLLKKCNTSNVSNNFWILLVMRMWTFKVGQGRKRRSQANTKSHDLCYISRRFDRWNNYDLTIFLCLIFTTILNMNNSLLFCFLNSLIPLLRRR